MMKSTLRIGPFALSLLALIPVAVGGACATAVENGSSSAGGGTNAGGASASSAAVGGAAASSSGTGHDAGPGTCSMATDCSAMNDPCNVGACVNGTCVKAPANEHGSCDDGLFCTDNDSCVNGVCVGGNAKPCSAPDSCHIGTCDEATDSCSSIPGNDGAQCDDGDACTLQGICSGGTCSKGPPVDCSVFNSECAIGGCMPGQGCVPMPINEGGLCNDGKPPTGCSQGICQMGTCASTPKNDGQACDDGMYCTINDHCQNAVCTGDPNPCAPPDNNCQMGVCNENTKSCAVTMAPNGTACDDGSLCTTGETCSNGICTNGQPANNGAACDDKNGCTSGTTCVNGTCGNPQSQINQCTSGDSCCPANCSFANDADCLYWASGVQQNVPNNALVGWSQCWLGTYGNSPNDNPNLAGLLQQCNKAKLLMACRQTGAQTWKLVAMGPRQDVLFDCGTQSNCQKQSNGVGFYYNDSYSWGFVPAGDTVSRNSCDFIGGPEPVDPNLRLCWHTSGGNISTGFRCGDNSNEPTFWLNSSTTWERALFQAD